MQEKPKTQHSKDFTNQGYGGMPPQTQGFEVQEHEVTNQPDEKSGWNSNMGNPVGPK